MGLCASAEVQAQNKVADVIEKQIQKDKMEDMGTVKMLLLGRFIYLFFNFDDSHFIIILIQIILSFFY